MQIEIRDIKKNYGKKQVLNGINFSVGQGECIGILGANGSGKSTLLSILAGVLDSNGGQFLLDGRDLLTDKKSRNQFVGYVPQGTPLIDELTALDNLKLWYKKEELEAEIKDGVIALLGVDKFLKTTVSKMSGGMKKRLSIACSIASHPPVIILDEPMAALDLVCKKQIYDYIKHHKSNGGIVLLATHDIFDLELCDRCYIVKNGTAQPYKFDGSTENLVESL